MAYPYRFRRGKAAGGLGTGASGMGLEQPQSLPANDGFMRAGYLVRRVLAPQSPGFNKYARQFTAVDLVGNGSNIQGQLDLAALAQMTKAGN